MPSLRTRVVYGNLVLATASEALVSAAAAVDAATVTLQAIETGTLDLDAVTIGGVRFVNNGGVLGPEP